MSDEFNEYSLGAMSGCIRGRVPTILDVTEVIASRSPVKYIVVSSQLPIYGYIDSLDTIMQQIDFSVEGGSRINGIRLDAVIIFSAVPLSPEIPCAVGSTIIVRHELFTVVKKNDRGMSVWLGSGGLIYYGEDMQSIISEASEYIALGLTS